MAMNNAAARVVDPVLSTVARGYRNPALAWQHLFPVVPVAQRGGKVIEFGAEDFSQLNIERAPGADRESINFAHSSSDYTLTQRALDGKVPRETLEEARAVPGINYQTVAVTKTMEVVSLQIELEAAKLATTAGNYGASNKSALSGSAQWDNDNSNPAMAVELAKEKIATGIGRNPNVLILGEPVYRALKNHPDIIDRIKHTEGLSGAKMGTVNPAKLAQYFDLESVIVARARKGKPGSFSPIWDKNVVLAYSNVSSTASMGSPSFGYCYRLDGYPMVESGYFVRKCASWIYPVTTEDTPVIAGKSAGYLFSSVVA